MSAHTRTSTLAGPDYCHECSTAANDWVQWPCAFVLPTEVQHWLGGEPVDDPDA